MENNKNKNKQTSGLNISKLKTLDEVEENSVNEEKYQDRASVNLIVKTHHPKNPLDFSPVASPDRKSNSSSRTRMHKKVKNFGKLTKKRLTDSSLTDFSSTNTPQSLNEDNQSLFESVKTPLPITIDYDKLIPNQCGDLAKLTYTNNLEKYLITRIYSNVNKLSTIIAELDHIQLEYFLNTPDQNECLPLYYAIKAECINSVKLLLNYGSSLNKTTKAGDPATHLACLLGVSIELIEFLLSYGGQVDLYKNDQEGWTILHCACNQGHLEIVKYLLEKKYMNPNVKDSHLNFTGLQLAAVNNRIEIIEYFLSFPTIASIKFNNEPEVQKVQKDTNSEPKSRLSNRTPIDSEETKSNLPSIKSQLNQSINESFEKVSIEKLKFKGSKKTKIQTIDKIILTEPEKEKKLVKKMTKISLEPNVVYVAENKFYKEPLSIYKNFIIDLNSQNSEGQTILHLACKYGKFDVVNLLLKKYGSNQIDVNKIDFKGRTCLDHAWYWLINLGLKQDETEKFYNGEKNKSIFYDSENSFYIQRKGLVTDQRIDIEIKLIFLLYQYGAKFSNFRVLMYDVETLKIKDPQEIDLPANLFYPDDHVVFNDLKIQTKHIVSIQTYLKTLLHVLKLNLPTMFLRSKKESIDYDFVKDGSETQSFETDQTWDNLSSKSFNIKKEFSENFQHLIDFIEENAIDPFEKQFYFHNIKNAFDLISKY